MVNVVVGRWSLVIGRSSLVIGRSSLVIGRWWLVGPSGGGVSSFGALTTNDQ
jgi:hypothetical protein